ncbi:MAG: M56 family metallopeptidase [Firmicutes bacterium]|nr:M56 family metallopeptidase [Bacillota bacterium]
MINWIAASSALIIIIAALRRILSGRIALRLQYALWLVVLVRLFFPLELGSLPFALSNAVEQIPIVQEFEDIQNVQVLEHTESGAVVGYTGTSDETAPLQIYDKKTDAEFTHIENTLKFRDIALPLWKAGIATLMAVFFASNLRLSRRLKKERALLSDTGDLPVYITSQVETPCLFGFFSPAIYVTPEVAADETVLRHTLEHELTHYRHWDQLWAVLRCCALALHWYNPLVWWAAKLSRNDAELACDEATLIRLGEEERAEYGRTLIRMTCQGPSRLLTTATTMTGSKGTLKERISLIAKKPKMALYTLIAVIIIAVCATVFTFTGSDVSTNRKLCDWMQSVTAEELSYAYISEGYGTAVTSYTLDSEFRAELVRILNSLEWNQFGMDQHTGAPERRLFAATGAYLDWDEEFIFGIREDDRISIRFLTEFGEEISKPNKGWYVTSPELSSFINDILDGKTSLQESSEYLRADLDADDEEEPSYDVSEEMKKVKVSDISELFLFGFSADEIVSALNKAADSEISASEATARGFGLHTMNFWNEKVYLGGRYETAVSGLTISFDMECGLIENIVKVSFGKGNLYATEYFEDEELYNLLRYRGYGRTGEIDQDAFEKYSDILTPTMEANLEALYDYQPVYDYELVEFYEAGSYTEADGATITVYDFDFGLLTWNPNDIGFVGGLYVDGYERLRGINVGQFAVRHRKGELTAYAFLGNDFSYNEDDAMKTPEDEEFIKEHLKNTLDFAEAQQVQ